MLMRPSGGTRREDCLPTNRFLTHLRCILPMKRLNPRRVKINRSYTVEEVARLFAVHKNSVRNWLVEGLQTVDGRRPILILGRHVISFISARRNRRRSRCRPGEMFCFKCRVPRVAARQAVDYLPYTPSSGNLRARCADCGALMFRRVSLLNLEEVAGGNTIQMQQAQPRIRGTSNPSVNCDLEKETDLDVTQPRK